MKKWDYNSGDMTPYKVFFMEERDKLLDYITNLQQKIKHYEETTTFGDYIKEVNLLVDYKSRIEKAVEYINYYGTTPEENDDTTCRHILKTLLNILNGKGSDE